MRSFLLFTLILLTNIPIAGQNTPPGDQEKPKDDKQSVELKWLNELTGEIATLRLAENRALALARVASALWIHDEKRARRIFDEAFAELAIAQNEPARRNQRADELIWGISPRHDMIASAESRDPALALRLLNSSRPARLAELLDSAPSENRALSDYAVRERELTDRLTILAASSEDRIKRLREIIRRSPNSEALKALRELKSQNPETAAELAALACERLANEDIGPLDNRLWLAAAFLGLAAEKKAPDSDEPFVEPAKSRKLAEKLGALWLSDAKNPTYGFDVAANAMKALVPEMFARLEASRQERDKLYRRPDADLMEKLAQDSTNPDAVLAELGRVSANSRDELRSLAAKKYLAAGETDKAAGIIDNELSGDNAVYVRVNFYRNLVTHFLKEGAVASATGAARKIEEPGARASSFIEIAAAVSQNDELGGRQSAEAILFEGVQTIGLDDPTRFEFAALVSLLSSLLQYNPDRCFELADPLIRIVDEVSHATVVAYGFNQPGWTKAGEVRIATAPIIDAFGIEYLLKALLEKDEQRTRNLIGLISRNDIRIGLKLSLVAPQRGTLRMAFMRRLMIMSSF